MRGNGIDIGSYEMHHVVVDNVIDEDDLNVSIGDISLREAIRLMNTEVGPGLITFAPGISTVEIFFGNLTVDNQGAETRIAGPVTIRRANSELVTEFRIMQVASLANLTLDRIIVENGVADFGGGINSAGTLNLVNSTVRANHATSSGGGVYSTGSLNVVNSTITRNRAEIAGGGLATSGITTIESTTISRNTNSGLFAFAGSQAVVVSSSLWGNSVTGDGGAIRLSNSQLELINSTVSGNKATGSGGGIFVEESSATLTNVTLVDNLADSDRNSTGNGGGIAVPLTGSHSLVLLNTLVAGNYRQSKSLASDLTAGSVDLAINSLFADPASAGGVVHGTNNNIVGQSDGGSGRMLLPLGKIVSPSLSNNGSSVFTHTLLPTSPAVDAGDNTFVGGLAADQRGGLFTRVVDGPDADAIATVDIGAFEFGGAFQKEDLDRNGTFDVTDILLNLFYYREYAFPNGGSIPTASLPMEVRPADVTGNEVYNTDDILFHIASYITELLNSPNPPSFGGDSG